MPFSEGICLPFQQALTEIAGNNSPALIRDRIGFLEALLSDANRSGIRQIAIPSDGKRRSVEIIYMPRGIPAGITNGRPDNYCNATDEPSLRSENIAVTRWKHRKLRLSEDEMRKICYESDPAFRANILMSEMNALLISINRDILAAISPNIGTFRDNASVKTVQLISPTFEAQFYEESRMLDEYDQVGGSGKPLIIGAGRLAHYVRIAGKGCCNTSGIDMSQAGDFAFFYDSAVSANFTPAGEYFLMLAPGTVHFLTWNANIGNYAYQNERDEAGTVIDPFTGIAFDLDIVFDRCTKRYNLTLALNYDYFMIPNDAFLVGDDLAGVNYTFKFRHI